MMEITTHGKNPGRHEAELGAVGWLHHEPLRNQDGLCDGRILPHKLLGWLWVA